MGRYLKLVESSLCLEIHVVTLTCYRAELIIPQRGCVGLKMGYTDVTTQLLDWCVCIQPSYGKRTLLVLCILLSVTIACVFLECKKLPPSEIRVVYELEQKKFYYFSDPS